MKTRNSILVNDKEEKKTTVESGKTRGASLRGKGGSDQDLQIENEERKSSRSLREKDPANTKSIGDYKNHVKVVDLTSQPTPAKSVTFSQSVEDS